MNIIQSIMGKKKPAGGAGGETNEAAAGGDMAQIAKLFMGGM
jgi:hypothetical protein